MHAPFTKLGGEVRGPHCCVWKNVLVHSCAFQAHVITQQNDSAVPTRSPCALHHNTQVDAFYGIVGSLLGLLLSFRINFSMG
jgi:hypothetical protein